VNGAITEFHVEAAEGAATNHLDEYLEFCGGSNLLHILCAAAAAAAGHKLPWSTRHMGQGTLLKGSDSITCRSSSSSDSNNRQTCDAASPRISTIASVMLPPLASWLKAARVCGTGWCWQGAHRTQEASHSRHERSQSLGPQCSYAWIRLYCQQTSGRQRCQPACPGRVHPHTSVSAWNTGMCCPVLLCLSICSWQQHQSVHTHI